ncbi:hypothetical protein TRV_08161 [Trichophyton verrucosum HKI 0517]|uniref:Uncharacterized protein n=1 Tax=Trichophyton verrucosum (strain HKI 0517) TaxID=663202 RepID=D4DLT7_TRIVH|nr:uncharacterized protein TRV_08161 [Trichophyton verrucosum HKI 0517]EFE37187.1 hypothetical protein TRV_08161 [Trichophyton verrucosum HKI 0517]
MREEKKGMKKNIDDDDDGDDTEVKKMLLSNGYQIRVVYQGCRERGICKKEERKKMDNEAGT